MKMKFKICVLILSMLLVKAYPCACDEDVGSILNRYNNASAVFVGKFVSSKLSDKNSGSKYLKFGENTFEIIENIKSDSTKTFTVLNENTDCGQYFQVGKQYLVYTFYSKRLEAHRVHECFSKCPEINTEQAQIELAELRKLRENK